MTNGSEKKSNKPETNYGEPLNEQIISAKMPMWVFQVLKGTVVDPVSIGIELLDEMWEAYLNVPETEGKTIMKMKSEMFQLVTIKRALESIEHIDFKTQHLKINYIAAVDEKYLIPTLCKN